MSFSVSPYSPPRFLRNGHLMTIAAWARRRRFPRLPEPEERLFEIDARTRLLAKCHWQPVPVRCGTMVLLHGLEGSADAHYMCGMADKAFADGLNVVRLNQRNCGGTDHLCEGVYHSGLTPDPMAVVRELIEKDGLRSIAVAGYSLGGNLALRMAGEYGADGPPEVRAFAAVSPTLDLEACVEALERPSNRIYEWNFVHELKQRIRRKAALYPAIYSTAPLAGLRSVRQFDETYTAPLSGFLGASDYYQRASSLRLIDRTRVPTLVITSEDDPFIPVAPFHHPSVAGNPDITLVITRHGGHCGFIASRRDGWTDDGYWAERTVVDFASARLGREDGNRGSEV